MNRKYMELPDGRQYSRTINTRTGVEGKWKEVPSNPDLETPKDEGSKRLYLVLENQAEGEPRHWFLFACDGESTDAVGRVWQVTGDATYMQYKHENGVRPFISDAYHTSFVLNLALSGSQEDEIEEAVRSEAPPSAVDRRAVRENCQGQVN
ncbi:uncharacterized protein DNG_08994 [Cephalotrichum gorgonifer]|uniref:Uncharacterized protein n=1 Tax=Cephalotrichum gorgonifer TaxID=2041049 RepID=A0AAE8N4W5_9PEZI|nr:uncharacterized protein DNG_08994 [Cephalotrichum gorgonifer]